MGIKEFFFGKEVEEYSPTIVVDEVATALEKGKKIEEQFQGEVEIKDIKFPKELGEEHPFDFTVCEGLYKKMGFVTAVIDKYVDFVVGPGFYIECESERAKTIIDQFMQDVNFDTILRDWIKEGIMKGNGFLELGGNQGMNVEGVKLLNANYMYLQRDKFGVIEHYNQYRGAFSKEGKWDKNALIPFKPYQIAHFPFNKVGDCGYGMGIIQSALNTLNNLLKNEKDSHMLMGRKANSPYHIKMGGVVGGKYYKPNPADVVKLGKELEYLHNKHEWTTDGLTDIKVLDFGNIGEKFTAVLDYDIDMLFYIFQIPAVIMGKANVPEGLAKVQMDAFERRIQSIQAEVEKVIEQNIFKRILNANGFDIHVEFQWGQPSDAQKMERLLRLKEMMGNLRLSDSLFKMMEKDVVKLLDYDENEYEMMTEEEERRREEERPQPLVPGENENKPQLPILKQKPKQLIPKEEKRNKGYETKEICQHCQESWENINDVQEWLNFNYRDYVKSISAFIKSDDFINIKAENDIEEQAGYLSQTQINELKRVLNKGFVEGRSIREIAKNIDNKVKPNDLYEITTDNKIGNLVRSKDVRSLGIARTEITRCANEGAIKQFEEAGITKIRWVSSAGDRTCQDCEALNGQIFETFNHPELPLHPYCRCTTTAVTELK